MANLKKALLASVITVSSVMGTLAHSAEPEKQLNLAGVLINTQDPFWNSIGCGAKDRAEELGVNLELFSSSTMDTAPITANFNAALLTKPDGFLGTTTAANQFITQYSQLMADGVPVVTGNATSPSAQYRVVWSSPSTDPYLNDLLNIVKADNGSMLVMGGIPGLYPLEVRYKPLVKALKEARPGLTEIEPIFSTFNINKATSGVMAALIANPDLKLIIASNGPDGVGAAAAIKAAGMVGKVELIAFDAVPPEVQALKEGVITALIAQSPAQIGAESVEAMVKYLRSGASGPVPATDQFIGIPQRLLTTENIDNPANAHYIYQPVCG